MIGRVAHCPHRRSRRLVRLRGMPRPQMGEHRRTLARAAARPSGRADRSELCAATVAAVVGPLPVKVLARMCALCL